MEELEGRLAKLTRTYKHVSETLSRTTFLNWAKIQVFLRKVWEDMRDRFVTTSCLMWYFLYTVPVVLENTAMENSPGMNASALCGSRKSQQPPLTKVKPSLNTAPCIHTGSCAVYSQSFWSFWWLNALLMGIKNNFQRRKEPCSVSQPGFSQWRMELSSSLIC